MSVSNALPIISSTKVANAENLRVGDQILGSINGKDLIFRLMAHFDYLVPFHYRNLKIIDAYISYSSLQASGLNLSEVPLMYVGIERGNENLTRSLQKQFVGIQEITFKSTFPIELGFLNSEKLPPVVSFFFVFIAIIQPSIWIDFLSRQKQLTFKLVLRGMKKSPVET